MKDKDKFVSRILISGELDDSICHWMAGWPTSPSRKTF